MTDARSQSPAVTGAPSAPGLARIVHRNIESLTRLRQAENARRTRSDRIADGITRFAGSMWFVYVHLLWFGAWLLLNGTGIGKWDPYPFVMLAMIASVESIFLSTFILISQNRMQRLSDQRAELDLQISLLTEHELTLAIDMIESVARHIGVNITADAVPAGELADIKRDVNPEKVVDEIQRAEAT